MLSATCLSPLRPPLPYQDLMKIAGKLYKLGSRPEDVQRSPPPSARLVPRCVGSKEKVSMIPGPGSDAVLGLGHVTQRPCHVSSLHMVECISGKIIPVSGSVPSTLCLPACLLHKST